MAQIQAPRGIDDLLPETSQKFRWIEEVIFSLSSRFNYKEIRTPILEHSEVFHRSMGETTDVVSKETYTFTDRGGESMTLRPEGTAGVIRALISNGLAQHLPLKFTYSGPMFRYERPQKGRYRQFNQVGVEALGLDSPWADIESIDLAFQFLSKLGLGNKVKLEINSLGDAESRSAHRDALVNFLKDHFENLSADSKVRFEKNPLRILDSKDAGDKKIVQGAPKLEQFLNEKSKAFFDTVLKGLRELGIPFEQNSNLVRGLDYYTHTVFEFTTTELGAQGTVLAGGRYDGLVHHMGGPQTAGVGWASGVERLAMLATLPTDLEKSVQVAVLPMSENEISVAAKWVSKIRAEGISAEIIYSGNPGKKFKKAASLNAKFAVIFGESEVASNQVTVKDLSSGAQETIGTDSLIKRLI